jgi:hypothetical protein
MQAFIRCRFLFFPPRRKNRIALAPAFAQHPPMLARVLSAAVNGIEAFPVEVGINSSWGDTIVVIVGLPDAAVKESRDLLLKPNRLPCFG